MDSKKIEAIEVLYLKVPQVLCCNPTWRKCGDETHTPKMGTWESSGTFKSSKFNYKGQNTLH